MLIILFALSLLFYTISTGFLYFAAKLRIKCKLFAKFVLSAKNKDFWIANYFKIS